MAKLRLMLFFLLLLIGLSNVPTSPYTHPSLYLNLGSRNLTLIPVINLFVPLQPPGASLMKIETLVQRTVRCVYSAVDLYTAL